MRRLPILVTVLATLQPGTLLAEESAERARAPEPDARSRAGYPVALIERPLTLPSMLFELALEVPYVSGGNQVRQLLGVHFGATRDIELGLSYAPGALHDGEYQVGKALSFDAAVTIIPDVVAARLTLPLYAGDPMGMAIGVGFPCRYTIAGRWQLYGLHDLLRVRLVRFAPDVADPVYDEVQAGYAAEEGGVAPSSGSLNVNLGARYQASPNLTAGVEMGYHFVDFERHDQPVSFYGLISWSQGKRLDLFGRVGLGAFDRAEDTFTVSVGAAIRL